MGTTKMAEFSGIVVYRKDYRERDMLVKILTDRFGFKMFFVRGARKKGFRLSAAILPFTKATYVGTINDEGLSFINAVKEAGQYQAICQDIVLNAYASYILGLAEAAFNDNHPLNEWYAKIAKTLSLVDAGVDAAILTNIVEVQLLGYFGVKPNLKDCVICHRRNSVYDFSESYGGLLCQKHWHLDPHRLHLDRRTIYFLSFFSQVDIMRLGSIKVKNETKDKLRLTLNQIYNNDVGINIKAKKFLDDIKNWPHAVLNDDE
ncbi:DNA recombination and repair protein RecO [Liquorilactobacillus sucicola DSM 21376 = JCM 15457]|uniref:DNA repair protein RecO n=1 Tax=Liquorilactobacillus sucicola TaxID=519050 RepID=UPI00043154D8|nr:DNA repair protein RecO [Liquorilactobacillus sucicola]GAJ25492.1 DNA recombination and repair protein RecO [Liquorilactobacillus sucicola DSM 21376 = JCM 15457]